MRRFAPQLSFGFWVCPNITGYRYNIDLRSQELEKLGFGLYDSFHIACAEIGKVDVLLTTDDRLIGKAKRYLQNDVTISNPVTWLMSVFQIEGESNNDIP